MKGDYIKAVNYYSRAVNLEINNPTVFFNLGNAYRKLEMTGEAIEVYQKIIELFPSTSMANRAQSYINELTAE